MTSAAEGTTAGPPDVDGERLLRRIDELAAIGATPDGGVTRLAYSPESRAARALVGSWLRASGLVVRTDEACNLVARLPGRAGPGGVGSGGVGPGRALGTGSHLDTVVDAGRLDGAYGVVAAVEVADAIARAGGLDHDLVVVAFENEEGARGTPGMVGSLAVAGALTPGQLAAPDDEGVPLAERLAAAGGDPETIANAAWAPGDLDGWVELHVEQGPVLETGGIDIGVVTAVTGRVTLDVVVTGAANHAGTTPMHLRQDAAVAAAHVVLAVHELAACGAVRVATTGLVRTEPGVRNVVAGRAVVGVDLRDTDDARTAAAVETLHARAAEIGTATGTDVRVVPGSRVAAVPLDGGLGACVARAADELGLTRQDLPSGAGHDTQIVAPLAPAGMVFVPSTGGVSHAPAERSAPEALVAGARVLLRALRHADVRPGPPRRA